MSIWDDRLLEVLVNDGPMSVGALAEHPSIRIQQPAISKRMSKLADHDLVVGLGNGVYQISDAGNAYLHGEYDVEKGSYLNSSGGENSTNDSGINKSGANGV